MKRFAICVVLAALSCFAPAAAHPNLAQVRSDLVRVHSFDQVAVSPDGTWVAWNEQVVTHRGSTDVASEAIFVAPVVHPEQRRRVTGCPNGTCDDASLAWSPDGTRLAFLTTGASGQAQLAVANPSDASAQVITSTLRGPVADPKWSPDGSAIAILYTKDGPKSPGPLNPAARDAGVLGSTYFEQRLAIVPRGGGAPRLVSPANLYIYEYDWSPNGSTFAATAAHGDGDANWWVANLYTIGTRSGVTTMIHHPALQIASPRWSGDGTRIAYIGGIMSDESITGGDVYVVPAHGGAATDLTPNVHASVTTLAWNGSRSTLALTELAGGEMRIATLNADTKAHTVAWHGEETIESGNVGGIIPGDVGVSQSRDGRVTALVRQSFTRAPELYLGAIGRWKKITNANAATPRIVTHARSITWNNEGVNVQGWLLYPDGYIAGKHYPMVVIAHGGPAFANLPAYPAGAFAFDAYLVSQGYFVLEPNPRGSYGQGEAFTRANVKDYGYGDFRDIFAGVTAAERAVPIDDKRVGIFGWSYGGYITMWAVTQTNRFRAAVSGAGLSDWLSYYGTNDIDTWMIPYFGASVYDDPQVYARSSPITFIKKARTPMLLVHGDRDAEVPITQSYEYWNALKNFGVPTQFVVYPDEGHLFYKVADQVDVARRLVGWFDRWMH